MTQPVETKVITLVRLTNEVYRDLEKKLPPPSVSSNMSPQEVGFRLGIQHVLALLREGYTTN